MRDDYTNAVPVAHMISSAETAAVLQIFLQRVQQAAGFTFSYCMIDKSKAEMKALREQGTKYLLCNFHMAQDVERFLNARASNITGKASTSVKRRIRAAWSALQRISNSELFEQQAAVFTERLRQGFFSGMALDSVSFTFTCLAPGSISYQSWLCDLVT